jgi:threonine synthase
MTGLTVECPLCDRRGEFEPGRVACDCGSALDPGTPPGLSEETPGIGIWRHREVVGSLSHEVSLGEASTPLQEVEVGGGTVLIKLEYQQPSGSYKDRGSAYVMSLLKTLGAESVAEDSSGNAGASYSAYAAAAGMGCDVFAPADTPEGKLDQIRRYGARLHEIPGPREAAHQAARSSPDYMGHAWAAPFLMGLQTFAEEVRVQAAGKMPEEILFPVGHGGLLYASYLAFQRMGVMPALTGVQAEACAPLCLAGDDLPDIEARPTIADAVRVTRPVRWRQLLRAVKESGGEWITVSEEEIVAAREDLGRRGHDVEPTSALPWAVVLGRGSGDGTLVPLTGSGWKARGSKTP